MRQVGGGITTSKSSQLIVDRVDRDQQSPESRVDPTGEESGGGKVWREDGEVTEVVLRGSSRFPA